VKETGPAAEWGRRNCATWRGSHGWAALLGRLRDFCLSWRLRPPRQLRVCENLALGDRRFLSVVEFGEQRFLLGGTGNSLAMLAVLSRTGGVARPEEESAGPVWRFVGGDMVRCR